MATRMFTPEPALTDGGTASIPTPEPTEFEFVLGRRQMASVGLVAFTALAIFTTAAYMVGKAAVPVVTHATPSASAPAPVAPLPETPAPQPVAKTEVSPEAPLFGIAEKKGLYLQLGSVERGFAVLMVQGARKVGYPAFVGSGTNPNVFRVLVGPFNDKQDYETAKAMFTSMGLDTFSRRRDGAEGSPSAETSHDATMLEPTKTAPAATPEP